MIIFNCLLENIIINIYTSSEPLFNLNALFKNKTKKKKKNTSQRPRSLLARVSETENPQSCFPVCSIF